VIGTVKRIDRARTMLLREPNQLSIRGNYLLPASSLNFLRGKNVPEVILRTKRTGQSTGNANIHFTTPNAFGCFQPGILPADAGQ
jgi:hypothetical protein